jgi:hypothetical protein
MNNQKDDVKKLHLEFIRLGVIRGKLTNRMLLILPEIYESGIWKKYAKSIYEYAGRFGGISGSAVEKRLRLERHLQDKPALRAAIGDVGINKVALVATMATAKTDEIFADKVLNMSKSAIQVLSKELRMKDSPTDIEPCYAQAEKITLELDEEMTFMFLKLKEKYGISANREMMRKILGMVEGGILIEKSGKGGAELVAGEGGILTEESGNGEMKVVTGDGIGVCVESVNAIVETSDFMNEMSCGYSKISAEESGNGEMKVVTCDGIGVCVESVNAIAETSDFMNEMSCGDVRISAEEYGNGEAKVVTGDGAGTCVESVDFVVGMSDFSDEVPNGDAGILAKRSAKSDVKNVTRYISTRLKEILPDRCSYPGCNKPRKNLHHTDRFSISKSHKSVTSLCKEHHEFMHNGLIENENYPKYWTLNLYKTPNQIDQLYRKYRREVAR